MKFLSRSGRESLKPSWHYDAGSLIWRLVPSGESRLIGEVRDAEKKSVAFFCLELKTGKPLWRDRTFDQPWWSGIEAVTEGVMVLHGFATPDLPGHRGITVVDLERGETIWTRPELTFLDLQGSSLRAGRGGLAGTDLLTIDLRSGNVAEEGSDARLLRSVPAPGLRVRTLQPSADGAETLDIDGFRIVLADESTAIGGERRFRSRLSVTDIGSGREVFVEMLQGDSAGRVPNVVFMMDGFLCYLRERQTLVGVRIPSGPER